MSVRAMCWAWARSGLTPAAKLVLLKLADNSDDLGLCWPSMQTVAHHCGITRQTVVQIVGQLEVAGLLTIERQTTHGMKRPHHYRLHLTTRSRADVGNPDIDVGSDDIDVVSADIDVGSVTIPDVGIPDIEPSEEEPSICSLRSQRAREASPIGKNGDAGTGADPPTRRRAAKHPGLPPDWRERWAEWWVEWPNKVGKAAAEKAYRSALARASPADLVAGIGRYIHAKPPDRQWCNPATWLNQDRWLDQPAPIESRPNGRYEVSSQSYTRPDYAGPKEPPPKTSRIPIDGEKVSGFEG